MILEGEYTVFTDMHSGGELKLDVETIYISGEMDAAVQTFKELFDMSPYAIACQCCGDNFDVDTKYDPEPEGDFILIQRRT